ASFRNSKTKMKIESSINSKGNARWLPRGVRRLLSLIQDISHKRKRGIRDDLERLDKWHDLETACHHLHQSTNSLASAFRHLYWAYRHVGQFGRIATTSLWRRGCLPAVPLSQSGLSSYNCAQSPNDQKLTCADRVRASATKGNNEESKS
ncbi:MAG: hypothetical protein KGJ60_11980, partial [Verrucomicrobiota bacterium]|nr:hypothetical protein [Verrucomicrobiota bacterium]